MSCQITINEKSIRKAAFIGCGEMGEHFISHLSEMFEEIYIFNTTKDKPHVERVLSITNVHWGESVENLAKNFDIIFSMVGLPKQVKKICNQILSVGRKNIIFVDFSTNSVTLTRELSKAFEEAGCIFIECPVSGGVEGARTKKILLMPACSDERFLMNEMVPFLHSVWGKDYGPVIPQGGPGFGQGTKLVNNGMIPQIYRAICDIVTVCKLYGLDYEEISHEMCHKMNLYKPWFHNFVLNISEQSFEKGFYAAHILKDVNLVLDEETSDFKLPSSRDISNLYFDILNKENNPDLGFHSLYLAYDKDIIPQELPTNFNYVSMQTMFANTIRLHTSIAIYELYQYAMKMELDWSTVCGTLMNGTSGNTTFEKFGMNINRKNFNFASKIQQYKNFHNQMIHIAYVGNLTLHGVRSVTNAYQRYLE